MNTESFAYDIKLSIDLGAACAPVGELLKELNASLAMWGVSEQLNARSTVLSGTLTTTRLLTEGDIDKVKEIILKEFNAGQPAWNVRVESFRRKPGNVQQQVA